jgi:hypothetical protein
MTFFNRIAVKLKDLSPAAIREIIVVFIILCLSIALSVPQYREDMEAKRIWNQMEKFFENVDK